MARQLQLPLDLNLDVPKALAPQWMVENNDQTNNPLHNIDGSLAKKLVQGNAEVKTPSDKTFWKSEAKAGNNWDDNNMSAPKHTGLLGIGKSPLPPTESSYFSKPLAGSNWKDGGLSARPYVHPDLVESSSWRNTPGNSTAVDQGGSWHKHVPPNPNANRYTPTQSSVNRDHSRWSSTNWNLGRGLESGENAGRGRGFTVFGRGRDSLKGVEVKSPMPLNVGTTYTSESIVTPKLGSGPQKLKYSSEQMINIYVYMQESNTFSRPVFSQAQDMSLFDDSAEQNVIKLLNDIMQQTIESGFVTKAERLLASRLLTLFEVMGKTSGPSLKNFATPSTIMPNNSLHSNTPLRSNLVTPTNSSVTSSALLHAHPAHGDSGILNTEGVLTGVHVQSQMQAQPQVPAQTISHVDLWYYKDPNGDIQGPYNRHAILDWHESGFFPLDLPLCKDCQVQKWIPLRELLLLWKEPRRAINMADAPGMLSMDNLSLNLGSNANFASINEADFHQIPPYIQLDQNSDIHRQLNWTQIYNTEGQFADQQSQNQNMQIKGDNYMMGMTPPAGSIIQDGNINVQNFDPHQQILNHTTLNHMMPQIEQVQYVTGSQVTQQSLEGIPPYSTQSTTNNSAETVISQSQPSILHKLLATAVGARHTAAVTHSCDNSNTNTIGGALPITNMKESQQSAADKSKKKSDANVGKSNEDDTFQKVRKSKRKDPLSKKDVSAPVDGNSTKSSAVNPFSDNIKQTDMTNFLEKEAARKVTLGEAAGMNIVERKPIKIAPWAAADVVGQQKSLFDIQKEEKEARMRTVLTQAQETVSDLGKQPSVGMTWGNVVAAKAGQEVSYKRMTNASSATSHSVQNKANTVGDITGRIHQNVSNNASESKSEIKYSSLASKLANSMRAHPQAKSHVKPTWPQTSAVSQDDLLWPSTVLRASDSSLTEAQKVNNENIAQVEKNEASMANDAEELGVSPEFALWCKQKMRELRDGNEDMTLIQILLATGSNAEVADYVIEYIGKSAAASSFTNEFIKRKLLDQSSKKRGKNNKKTKKSGSTSNSVVNQPVTETDNSSGWSKMSKKNKKVVQIDLNEYYV